MTHPPTSILAPALRTTTLGLVTLVTIIAFEAMAVSTALPTAARDLHGLGSYGLAFTGFLVTQVVGMVASGQASDRRGPVRPLVTGLIAFVTGLLLAGTATTMAQLVAGRIVQGLGAGLIITAAYVVIGQVYPAALQPRVFAAISSAWVVPSLVGPVVSGAVTQHLTWRLVFLALVPVTLVGGALTAPILRQLRTAPPTSAPPADRLRIVRAFAVALGVGGLGLVAEHPATLSIGVVVPVGLAMLLWGLHGLLPPGTVRVRPGVAAPIALRGLLAGAFFGVESLVPLSLQVQHGFGATAAGLPLTVSGVTWAIGSWWQGRGTDDAAGRRRIRLLRVGFALLACGVTGMAVTALPATSGLLGYPSWLVAGLGMGLAMSSLSVVLLRETSPQRRGQDAAALQLADATASGLTTAAAGMLVAAAARGALGYTPAFVVLDLAMAAVAVLGCSTAGRARPAGKVVARRTIGVATN